MSLFLFRFDLSSLRCSGVATRLSAPGTGRAPVILESSGQGNAGAQGGAGAFVICEICDGFIKDLEQLRTHMQWIHKVGRSDKNCSITLFREMHGWFVIRVHKIRSVF